MVESVDIAGRRAEQRGGRRLAPPTQISAGRIALITDPQGAVFAVFQSETDPSGTTD